MPSNKTKIEAANAKSLQATGVTKRSCETRKPASSRARSRTPSRRCAGRQKSSSEKSKTRSRSAKSKNRKGATAKSRSRSRSAASSEARKSGKSRIGITASARSKSAKPASKPEKIKRPMNSFAAYVKEQTANKSMSKEQMMAIMKQLGENWNNMSPEQKEIYTNKAKEESIGRMTKAEAKKAKATSRKK